jgi:hypothetical protein
MRGLLTCDAGLRAFLFKDGELRTGLVELVAGDARGFFKLREPVHLLALIVELGLGAGDVGVVFAQAQLQKGGIGARQHRARIDTGADLSHKGDPGHWPRSRCGHPHG